MARIESVVVRSVVSLPETATFSQAAALMSERRIGSLGVRREGRLVGIVTERDLLARLAEGADPTRAPVRDAMQSAAATVSPWATEAECAELMKAHRTRHLAVVDQGEIVGIVSMLDLVELVVEEKQWSIDQLESYIRGGRASQLSQPLSSPFSHPNTEDSGLRA
jgi:CBS domain-containing protein